MDDDINNVRTKLKMHMMGDQYRAGFHAKTEPIGDRMINAVRGAIWEAWEIGRNADGQRIYPSIPLLERQPAGQEQPEL
jgi:hypothetical protein